ncbi:MAG: Stk1 family PASTA domain-containing Ser/Thr kinase [Rhodoluna sp.]|jgi:serine/threonine protein kinase|nr:Stk1 family PASTA domain-containing Ser/Thr kinase [Rhodoluna sp.]
MSNLIGQLIGNRYRVESQVASGGMATVYLATDQRLDRQVAIKVIHQHLANDPNFQEKFVLEAKTAAKLAHPNLVNVFDQGTDAGTTYLVMEYVPGITLRDALNEYGPLPAVRALEMMAQILSGLAAAHRAGILHRDLKPDNVLLADDGRVKLGDFGLARAISAHTSTGDLVGTIAYLSPELVTRGQADARSDVYAAGILLFELLTGKQPFEGEQAVQIAYQHANSTVPAPSGLASETPQAVDRLVAWATAKLPADRPADAGELLSKVNSLTAELKAGNAGKTTVMDFAATDNNATQVINPLEQASETFFDSSATQVLTPLEVATADQPLQGFQRRVGLRLTIATLLVVLFASGAGWWFGSGPGALSVIPNLTSRTVDSAESALAALSPKLSLVNENSSTVTKGLVIRTDPPAGSYLAKGSELKLFISLGPKLIAAPSLVGMNVAEATTKLIGAGFRLGPVNSWFDSTPIGQVYDHLGSDGTPIPEGSAIELQVSLGPIPMVSGIDQAFAVTAIEATGLKISSIQQEFSDTVAPGKAIGLVPQSKPLGAGGSVQLLVSKGPNLVIMPKVVGETVLAAKALLEGVGLTVIVNTDQLQSKWGIVKVKRSSEAPGAKLKAGNSVTISTR